MFFVYYIRHSAWTCHVQMGGNGFFYTPVLFSTPVKCHNDVNDIWLCCFKMKHIRLSFNVKFMFVVMVYQRKFELGITLCTSIAILNIWTTYELAIFFYNIYETFQNVKQLIYEQLLYLRESRKCIVSVITSSEAITIFLDWDSIKPQWCTVVLRLCNKCTQKTLKNVYTTVTVGFSSTQHSRWWFQWVIYAII